MKTKPLQIGLLLATLTCAGSSHATAYKFSFALTGPQLNSIQPLAINDAGQIAGYSYLSSNSSTYHAALLNGGAWTDLTPLPGYSSTSSAAAINNAGQTAGQMQVNGVTWAAVKWGTNGSKTLLPSLLAAKDAVAYGINNSGVVVGASTVAGGLTHAVQWNGTQATDLGALGGKGYGNSTAKAISDAGVTVGYVTNASYVNRAVKWEGGTISELAMLSGDTGSGALSVNLSGRIAGYGKGADGFTHAMSWVGGQAVQLGGARSLAYDINDAGQAVGYGADIYYRSYAALWTGGKEVLLDQYLDPALKTAGWKLTSANSINNYGEIVGIAENTKLHEKRVYVLSAVPEPETYGMLLGGLMVMGWAARRRKAA